MVELRGRQVWIAGTHPRMIVRRLAKVDPNSLSRDADLRILLCHFPRVLDLLEPGRFDLVLAGHMHDGQICVPYPGGKIRLAHPTAPLRARRLPDPGRGHARLAGPRHDVRAVPLRGAPGGDRAGAADGATLDLVDGQSSISTDILARYAADAAGEVIGVRGLSESSIPGRRGGVRVSGEDAGVARRAASRRRLGRVDPGGRARGAAARARVPPAHGRRRARLGRRRRRGDRADAVTTRIAGLTYATLPTAPSVCHECIWWQSREGRSVDKRTLDPRHRGRVGRVGLRLLRRRRPAARLDAVRAVGAASRAPPSCRPARRATTRSSSRARTSPTRRSRG